MTLYILFESYLGLRGADAVQGMPSLDAKYSGRHD